MERFLFARVCATIVACFLFTGCGADSSTGGGGGGDTSDAMMMGDSTAMSDAGASDAAIVDEGFVTTPCVTDDMCPADQYCRASEGGSSICAFGCREGGCEEGRRCDLERRNCVRDLRCASDDDCFGGEYCNEGECADGCRVGNEDDCPRDDEGRPRTCDPATHTCALQVVCCGEDNACSLELPENCATPLEGERGCFNPNPCRLLCEEDADCEAGLYCNGDGRCVEGCRLTGISGCRDDRICDADTRDCIRPPCGVDDDCPNDMFCQEMECLPGCRVQPDNCRRGEYCDPDRRRCLDDEVPQDCRSDEQCAEANGAGWFCDGQDCQPPCANHGECPAGEACGPDGRCFEGCRDDGYEDNDERGTARALVFDGNSFDSGEQLLYACSRDADWFTFETPAEGMTIDVAVEFLHAAGNLDLRLYGPDGALLDSSNSRDDNESIRLASEADDPLPQGQFYVEVYGRGFDENSYRLRIALARGLGPDDAEPDNSAATATVVDLPNMMQTEEINDRTIHPNDEDWFAVDLGNRDGVSVRLDMLGNDSGRDDEFTFEFYGPGYQDGDAPLLGPNGAGEGANGVRFVNLNINRFNVLINDGRYYVRVRGLNGNQVGRYRLTVSVNRYDILCFEDAAEPNNASEDAHDLMAREDFTRNGFDGVNELRPAQDLTLEGLTLCNDEDWYQVSLRANDSLEVRLERQEMDRRGDTSVTIYDSQGNEVGVGVNGQAVNTARVAVANEGIYRIKLESRGMTRTAYNLVLFRTAGALPCGDDRYDAVAPGNDNRGEASGIEPGNYMDLSLCGAEEDEDWYSFDVDSQSTVTVAIRFAHQQGDLDLDVFYAEQPDSLNAGIRAGHSMDDDEVVVLQNRAPGNYQFRVRSIGGSNVRYSVEVTVEERVFACMDDQYEPNATFADSIRESLGQGVYDSDNLAAAQRPWACFRQPSDIDTFHFVVPAGVSRTVATTFLYGDDGDLFLQLFDADEMAVLSTGDIQRGNSKQCMIIPAGNNRRSFYLRVVPLSINQVQQDDERLDYRLVVQPGEDCGAILPETPGVEWPRLGE